MSNPDRIIRLKTVLARTGLSRSTLCRKIAAGEVETVKLGKSTRITTASLHDLVRRQRAAG